MKLNKRKCRAFANPDFKFPQNNGILHASQIIYIVRTAVKIINHHKTLILYIYPRKQVIQGDLRPCMTVFQCKDDFTTLTRKEDNSTVWRKSTFYRLNAEWNFAKQCAFYSIKDEQRVSRYFKADTDSGFTPLIKAQDAILARRRKEHQLAKEKAIIDRMAGIPALPRNLKSWIRKSVMPVYFFYDYKRGGRNVPGVCSACGREIILSGVKQGSKHSCPHCKHELIAKPRSRRGSNMHDRDTCEVIQNMGDGRIVVRIIKTYCYYKNSDTPEMQIYENARQFIWLDTDRKVHTEHYYYDYSSGLLTDWCKGTRPVYVQCYDCFEADTCGHLYTKNLPDNLIGTPWQYCPIADFYNHFLLPMQVLPFLISYLEHPRMEHLVKVGLYQIAADLAYRYNNLDIVDQTQNRTHRILQIATEDVPFLCKIDADLSTLKIFQQYNGIKDRQELLLWQLENDVKHNILPILKYITVHKLIRYTERQLRCQCKNKAGSSHYQKIQDIVTDYRDYLEMCHKLNSDMKNSFVLYPKSLKKCHDRIQKRIKIKESEQLLQDFKIAVQDVREHMTFEFGGLKTIVAETPRQLELEGNTLHHCVGRYADRVAQKESIILFLRRCADETKPFFTIEVQGKEIVQVRGLKNCEATPEVQRFIDAFKRQVLQDSVDRNAA